MLERLEHLDGPGSHSAPATPPRRSYTGPVIRARELAKRFGAKRVLRGLDLDVRARRVPARDRAERVRQDDAAAPRRRPRSRRPRASSRSASTAAGSASSAHEPLVYRELTALENLDLFGRLYRVPERRERIGMLLERFGLWDVRGERVGTFSRGMQQRLALCRALLHDPELLLLDEPFNALDADGAELLDRELAELAPGADVPRRHPRPGAARARSRRPASRFA